MASADAAERILLSVRADVLRQIVQTEARLEKKYAKKIDELQKKLRSGKSVSAKVRKAMAEISNEVEPDIERLIQSGAIKGKQAARKSFKKLFGSRARSRFPTDQESLIEAGKRIRGTTTVDKIPLSKRLWRAHSKAGADMAKQVQASMRAGNSMQQTAEEILRRRHPRITPPQYAEKLAQAARRGGDVLTKVSAKYEAQLNRLGSAAGPDFTMRPIARELVRDLQKAKPDQVDAVVKRFMKEKAQRHATMIARSESIEAYKQSYRKSTEDQDWTKGYRWSLGANHPKPDECDILAGQNLYGLGPGGYPADAVPDTPHPNDMCVQVAIIDTDHFKREKAKRNNEPEPPEPWKQGKKQTSEQWLKKQSQSKQKQILGPTKYERFKQAPGQVLGKDGIPKRVKDLPARRAASPAPPRPSAKDTAFSTQRITKPGEELPSTLPAKKPIKEYNANPYRAAMARGGYKEEVLKPGMSLSQAQKAIAMEPVEHAMGWQTNGKVLFRHTDLSADSVGYGLKAVQDPGVVQRRMAIHLHNHPSGASMFSDGDLLMKGRTQLLGEAHTITPRGSASKMKITDPEKWQRAWSGKGQVEYESRINKAVRKAADKASTSSVRPFTEEAPGGPAYHKRWMKTYAKEAEPLYNEIGKDFGFEISQYKAF